LLNYKVKLVCTLRAVINVTASEVVSCYDCHRKTIFKKYTTSENRLSNAAVYTKHSTVALQPAANRYSTFPGLP